MNRRRPTRLRTLNAALALALAAAGAPATAAAADATVKKAAAKVPYRGSRFTYGHVFNALSLDKSAELTYNPYYAMSFGFLPNYYFTDDLSLSAGISVILELTQPDSGQRAYLTDLDLTLTYAPSWMKIPVVGVVVTPSLGVTFPTSEVSQSRSLILGVTPGVSLSRRFRLHGGRYVNRITLGYSFAFTKNFNEFTTQQLDFGRNRGELDPARPNTRNIDQFGCRDLVNRPECLHSGVRNVSMSVRNNFSVSLAITGSLSFSVRLGVINHFVYPDEGRTVKTRSGQVITVGDAASPHRGLLSSGIALSYTVADWLSLTGGVSTVNPQLKSTSDGYRPPFFNRFTNFYVTAALPIDALVARIRGEGAARR